MTYLAVKAKEMRGEKVEPHASDIQASSCVIMWAVALVLFLEKKNKFIKLITSEFNDKIFFFYIRSDYARG